MDLIIPGLFSVSSQSHGVICISIETLLLSSQKTTSRRFRPPMECQEQTTALETSRRGCESNVMSRKVPRALVIRIQKIRRRCSQCSIFWALCVLFWQSYPTQCVCDQLCSNFKITSLQPKVQPTVSQGTRFCQILFCLSCLNPSARAEYFERT